MQDHCAENLSTQLGTLTGKAWSCDVWEPPNPVGNTTYVPTRSVTRVHEANDPADDPQRDCYDVIEGYWSPLDKGKTTASSVIAWILRSVFIPLNTAARYIASRDKKASISSTSAARCS